VRNPSMRCKPIMCRLAILMLPMLLLGATVVDAEIIAPQSKPWRVGICGGWTVGYLGVLAHHGMPAERILESEILNSKKLAKYDCIIVGVRAQRDASAWAPLERYVRQGGCLVSEMLPMPSAAAIPGKRLKPGRVPNLQFVDAISPITQGLDFNKVMNMASRQGCSIIPEPNSGTAIIARYTYKGISSKIRQRVDEHFRQKDTDGKQIGSPAILMRHLDKGILVYAGCPVGFSLSLRGDEFAPMLINLLQYLSKGEIHDRFYTGEVEKDDLLTAHLEQFAPEAVASRDAVRPKDLPDGYETLEKSAEAGQDFWVYGTLSPDAEAEILFNYQSPNDYRKLGLVHGQVTLQSVTAGKAATVRSAKLDNPLTSGADVVLRSRGRLVVCYVDGKRALAACPGAPQSGAVLCQGLEEAGYQPSAPVYFADDFMREEGSRNEWETVSGQWKDVVSTGKAERGVNPFKYQGTSGERAIATAGHWFWQDYAYQASVQGAARAAGILFYYEDVDNYYLLRLAYPHSSSSKATLELVHRADGKNETLASTPVTVAKGQWCKLGIRASGSSIVAVLDDVPLLYADDEAAGSGAVGLYSEGGATIFDDVRVTPWQAAYTSASNQPAMWQVEAGQWQDAGEGKISGIGKALLPYKAQADTYVSVPIKVGSAQAAGVYMRYGESGSLYLAALVRQNPTVALRLFCSDGERSEVLAEKRIGGSPDEWHELTFAAKGPLLTIAIDGKTEIQMADCGPRVGRVGLYARGNQPAHFKTPRAWALVDTDEVVDQLMPAFAGIIDRHTWAGRPGAWHPEHDELNRFWHQGYFPGPVSLVVGVHPLKEQQTATHLYLTREHDIAAGYQLIGDRVWAEDAVKVTLLRHGEKVASATAPVKRKKPYLLSLRREGGCVWGEVNGQAVVVSNNEQAEAELCRLGITNEGRPLMAEDLAVYTPWARNYTFMTAPTDWIEHSGTWETTNRWSCSPQWTWYCGHNGSGPAEASSKVEFIGDLDLSFYVAARMMPRGDGKHYEQLRDIHIGICSGPNGSKDGYLIKVGGHRNQYTSIERRGKQVKRSSFTIPNLAIHNDWLQLGVRKRGAKIELLHWGHVIMEYTDPEPLNEGGICLGTDHNGILIPRLTVYGQVSKPRPDPLALPTG